ncbi:MAG: thioredoxin family protein, partial [Akkermansiaceae bacterium]|nr:thioredoxin family protein [Akkermansiaceae bacterium]
MKPAGLLLSVLILPVLADSELRERLRDRHVEGREQWIYNNLAAGFAKAQETGKPLLVTFRCVPCKDCMEFDGLVAGESAALREMTGEF